MSSFTCFLCNLFNGIGLAWWARIETSSPNTIYWYGPFLRYHGLERSLPIFLADITSEGPKTIKQIILRTHRHEPFTIDVVPS
ncbi:hypothetical protein PMYN1_Chma189 (chromatophore) [Paulinella micropora]|uniref:DUF1816 domain-containing protein n=1 Tax=Paulinella micropora TaxID=1928728 RepID=A0A5K7VS62_9EUKA|nr:hypothetical protein PMYN1_Chma189 [Paulinella micropora]